MSPDNHNASSLRRARRARGGFTLIECLTATALLAILASAMMTSMATAYQHSRDADEQQTALRLAEQMLERIASRPHVPGATMGGSEVPGQPETFVTVTSFHGLDQTITASGSTDATHDAGGSYRRQVTVDCRSTPAGTITAGGSWADVTVTVTTASGRHVVLRRLIPAAGEE